MHHAGREAVVKPATISVVIPMYNAAALIPRCLEPLMAMRDRGEIEEIVVVDDCSTDRSTEVAALYHGVHIVRMPVRSGPAAARNLGAKTAVGTYLWFIDSDVVVAEDAARVLRGTLAVSGATAVMGSYDDAPAARNFLSQYKNLVHHYYHHGGSLKASTFWAGCGAIERNFFLEIGGFDACRYRYPSIEDIELGYRIIDAGGAIVLEPRLQGKHLKEWRLFNLLHTEIVRRALPWSRLMLERKHVTDDLNVSRTERMRAALALLAFAAVFSYGSIWSSPWLLLVVLAALGVANARFLVFFARARGPLFALGALLFHQLYYGYSSASFASALVKHYVAHLGVKSTTS